MAPQAGSVAAALPYGNYLGGIALKGGSQHEKEQPAEPRGDHCAAKHKERNWQFSVLSWLSANLSRAAKGVKPLSHHPSLGGKWIKERCDFKFCPQGNHYPCGEVYIYTVPEPAESLARFGPPGSGLGTPSPGSEGDRSIIPIRSLIVLLPVMLQPNNRI